MARWTKDAMRKALAELDDDERAELAKELKAGGSGDSDIMARLEQLATEVDELKKKKPDEKKKAGSFLDFLGGLGR